jgi:hypothetical protein
LSIELSTPAEAGSLEETRDWELRLDEVRRQGLAHLWETAANLSRRLGHGFDAGEPARLPNNAYGA